MEHNFFDSVFVLLFYFCFIFYFLFFTDARRASDKNRVRKTGVMSRDFAPPLLLLFSVPVSVSVQVIVVGVIVVVFLVYWGRAVVGMCILAGGRWLIMPDPWPFFFSYPCLVTGRTLLSAKG